MADLPVVDQRAAQQREVSLVVVGEVLVQEVRGDQLQHAKELQPLVGAQREVVEADAAVGEGPRQEPDVVELDAGQLLELWKIRQNKD